MPASLSPQEFVAKWKQASGSERAIAQSHFNDLCELIRHPKPIDADPSGTSFTFEAGATKQAGGEGWADVWKKGCFAWEYKGKHANLDRAYQQLLQYKDALQNPPLLIVSDIERIRIYTNFTNTVKKVYEFTLEDLLKPESISRLRDAFTSPDALRAAQTTEQVTQQAAVEFGRLAEILRKWGAEPLAAAHFLIRILFCLFAEDVDLLPKGVFTRLVMQARRRPAAFRQQLVQLFAAMTTGGFFGSDEVPHFDGGLFDDASALDMDSDALEILARVSGLDWSGIKPSIFGTLFERSLDPSKRAQLGAHYTGEEDILLVVEPVLMAPLRRHWVKIQAQVHELADERAGAKGAQRTKLEKELFLLLRDFRYELAAIRVLDAACGSGNFLYVALRLLLDLEKEVINLASALGDTRAFPLVSPEQLYGIEVNPYAHELAQVTVWIGYIQWMRENGFGAPSEPILKPLHNIILKDAILAYDDKGNPWEPEWPEADVIIGNPPFLGGNKIRQELGDDYVEALFKLYHGRVPAFADLVCYWFEKARAQIAASKAKRAGLLATQSIRGGASRKVLERIKESGDIYWAQSDRNWLLNGAAVHISMIGFDDGGEQQRTLDNRPVAQINPDLTAAADLSTAKRLRENADLCFYGSQQKGSFDITEAVAVELLAQRNPFGLDNRDVIRPSVNAKQLLQRTTPTWVIDFGVDMPIDKAALYEAPFEYVRRVVLPERATRGERRQRDFWWLHARPSPRYREVIRRQERYIATPTVSKHRVFVWLSSSTLADHAVVVFASPSEYFFGVLQSRVHELWARATGTQVREAESGFRYTPSTTFETFPFPWPPGQEPQDDPSVQAIAQAARDLVFKRDAWLSPQDVSEAEPKRRSLTNLYNQRPTWLDLAHRKLDDAVMDAYGWPHDLSDEQMLTKMLQINLARANAQPSDTPSSPDRDSSVPGE